MPTEDASGTASPVTDALTSADDGSSHTISTNNIVAAPSRIVPAMGARDTPSADYPPVDAANSCASLVDPMVAPAMLSLASGMVLDGSWHAHQRVRVFFDASFRRVLRPPMLRKA